MADWNPSPRCSATHKLVIYMTTFSRRISPFFPEFRHFLVSARGKLGLAGCGKTPCKNRPRFDFLRSEQARRERLSDARAGSSERSPGRLCEPGGDGAAGSSAAADPPAGERGAGASVA